MFLMDPFEFLCTLSYRARDSEECSFLVGDTVTILVSFALIFVRQFAQLLVSIELSACLLPMLELVFLCQLAEWQRE